MTSKQANPIRSTFSRGRPAREAGLGRLALLAVLLGSAVYLAHPVSHTPTKCYAFGVGEDAQKAYHTLTVGTTDSVGTSIDPAEASDSFSWEMIRATGCGLVQINEGAPNGAGEKDIVPSLATDWSVSGDGRTWTFNLRRGVKFADGTEFNATHVKYSIDRGIGLAVPDGAFVGMGFGDIIDRIEVANKYQVKFHLKIPFGPFLALMASPVSYMVNPNYAHPSSTVSYVEGDARASCPNDLGPYILTKWTRKTGKDYEMRFEANPNYWDKGSGLPRSEELVIRFYFDPTALAVAIDAGDVDVAFGKLEVSDINNFKAMTNVKVWEGTGQFIQYLVFQQKIKPFDDARVRRAVAAALNRTALCKTVFLGQAVNLYSMIPNGMIGHIDAYKMLGDANYTFTTNTLRDLGYTETNKLVVDLWYETSGHYPQSPEQVAAIKSSLEASGVITVNEHGLDWRTYRVKTGEEGMPAYIYGWYPDYVDPDNYVYPFLHSSGSAWLHDNYANPQMDALVENARSSTDAAVRQNLYNQVQQLMVQDAPVVPMLQSSMYAVAKPNIRGVFLDISGAWRLWLVYKACEVDISSRPRVSPLIVDGLTLQVADQPWLYTWALGTNHTLTVPQTTITEANTRYIFTAWSDGSKNTTRNITATTDTTMAAEFQTQHHLTLLTDPKGLVAISGQGWYTEGTRVQVIAPSVAYYRFDHWALDTTDLEGRDLTITMEQPRRATAYYTLDVSELDARLSQLATAVSSLSSKVSSLEARVTNLESLLQILGADIQAVWGRQTQLEEYDRDANKSIGSLEEGLGKLKAELGAFKEALTSFTCSLEASLSDICSRVADLQSSLAAESGRLEGELDSLSAQTSTNITLVSTGQIELARDLTASLDLQERLTSSLDRLQGSLNASIQTLEKRFGDIEQIVNATRTLLSATAGKVGSEEGRLDRLESQRLLWSLLAVIALAVAVLGVVVGARR